MLQGIVSVVPNKIRDRLIFIREKIYTNSGLETILSEFTPHITWQVIGEYDLEKVEQVVASFASNIKPFKIRTTGMGIFGGSEPIIYIPVVRTRYLSGIQQKIWELTHNHFTGNNILYTPQRWVPHITLLPSELVMDNLPCVIEQLVYEDFNWEFEINNFEIFQQNADKSIERLGQFKFNPDS